MNISKTLTLSAAMWLITLGASGCTKQSWYEGAKQGAENECRHQPQTEMDRCLERLNKKTYEDYEKARTDAK